MATVDRTPIDQKRATSARARAARLQAQADLATRKAAHARLSRTVAPSDPRLAAVAESVAAQQQIVERARLVEKRSLADLTSGLASWLPEDPTADVGRLESRYPIVLFPLRLETRFIAEHSELRIRIYPDEISTDAHEPELSAAERDAGATYWAAAQANGGNEDLQAWRKLSQVHPSTRAAWIVRVTDPNAAMSTSAFAKPPGWSRAVEARLLPDRFIAVATRGSIVKRAFGLPVVEPLAVSVGPNSLDGDKSPISPDGTLILDEGVQWTIDFEKAVSAGMAIRIPLEGDDLRLGFDRILVVGVKASMDREASSRELGALLDAHHYTAGLSFVKQGTPTSNVIGTPAAYPPADENGARSFDVERGEPLDTTADGAAAALTSALGLGDGVFTHVDGADLSELAPARQMNRVLFSATLGYYLDQMMAPLVPRAAVDEVGRHLVEWVIGRGTASAIRVGRVPYGVLAATSLAKWQHGDKATPVERKMVAILQQIRSYWLQLASQAPHVGRSSDPDQDLLDILVMDASARQARVRRVVGDGVYLNLAQLFNWPVAQWENAHETIGKLVLAALGLDASQHPRVIGQNFSDHSTPYHGPLVDVAPLSETQTLAYDYVTWIKNATIEQLRLESVPPEWPADVTRVLLYRFLRHAALGEYHWWAGALLEAYPAGGVVLEAAPAPAAPAPWREPEFVGIVPGTEARETPWQRFQNQVELPGVGSVAIAPFLEGDSEVLRALTGVGAYRDALAALAPLPTAELERVFTESLDVVSHRVDAWVTSLASQRLESLRNGDSAARGSYIGAFGWAENLQPESVTTAPLADGSLVRTTPGGYVQAPSMSHAMTAAVLRNAYLTHLGQADTPYAVDLSSAQVRMARFILDSVRNGQPVGAVFGYLIERALHERQVETLIDPIRQAAPLVANKVEDSGEPAETVAARNVVDGLTLRNKWKNNQLFDVPGGLPGAIAHRDVLEQELGRLDRDIDAVADLLLAESVHQVVRGNVMAGSATLDSLAQGTRPPDPDVGRAATGGTTLTHRLAVLLDPAAALGPGWSAAPTARAACEPRIDRWAATLLGDPRDVRCRVTYQDPNATTTTVVVTFDQLGLRPLDVIALAKTVAVHPEASELDRRVLHAAFGDQIPPDAPRDASFSIVYAPDPAWDRAALRTFPELLDVASAIAKVVGGARPLQPLDVVLPENASRAASAVVDIADANARAGTAMTALSTLQSELRAAVEAVTPGTAPTPSQIAELRKQLRAAAAFGIAAAFPSFVAGGQEGGIASLALVSDAASALADIELRLSNAAKSAGDAPAQARAVFGREFTLITGFAFPVSTDAGAELAEAVAYGPAMVGEAHLVEKWLMQVSPVREALGCWRMLRILSEAMGTPPSAWTVAQLPHVAGGSWIALPPKPGEDRPSGKLSLVLQADGAAPDLTLSSYGLFLDEWVETIPNASEHAGVAFRYEDTGGEAPQTIIVAVSPTTAPAWDFDSLVAILNETLDLAKIRAVDLETLDPLAQLIPTIFLAANAGDETISTTLGTKLDPTILEMGVR